MLTQSALQQQNSNQYPKTKKQNAFVATRQNYCTKKYGKDCGFEPEHNVFNLIEYLILANWSVEEGLQISKQVIAEACGLKRSVVEKVIKSLAAKRLITIENVTFTGPNAGKVWEESIYKLNPERYGTNILWAHRPKKRIQFVALGKMVKNKTASNDAQNPPPPLSKTELESKDPLFKTELESKEGSLENPPCVEKEGSFKTELNAKEGSTENPLLEPVLPPGRNLKECESISQEEEDERFLDEEDPREEDPREQEKSEEVEKNNWASVRAFLVYSNPGEEKTIDSIYRELQTRGTDDMGRPIGCLPALLYSSYRALRNARKNPYPTRQGGSRSEGNRFASPGPELKADLSTMMPFFARFAKMGTPSSP